MTRLCPGSWEGRDYRLPRVEMLKRWRRCLEPITHFMSLSAMDKEDAAHLLSDVCSKKQVSVFHIDAKLEFKTE
jgi:hypothetical protein